VRSVFRGPGELVGLWVPGRYLALFFNPMTLSVGIRLLWRVAFMIHDVIVTNNVYWTLGDKGWIKPTCTYKRLYTYTQETENVSDNCVRSRTRVRLQRVQLLRGGRRSFSGSGDWSADTGAGHATAGERGNSVGRGWVV